MPSTYVFKFMKMVRSFIVSDSMPEQGSFQCMDVRMIRLKTEPHHRVEIKTAH